MALNQEMLLINRPRKSSLISEFWRGFDLWPYTAESQEALIIQQPTILCNVILLPLCVYMYIYYRCKSQYGGKSLVEVCASFRGTADSTQAEMSWSSDLLMTFSINMQLGTNNTPRNSIINKRLQEQDSKSLQPINPACLCLCACACARVWNEH